MGVQGRGSEVLQLFSPHKSQSGESDVSATECDALIRDCVLHVHKVAPSSATPWANILSVKADQLFLHSVFLVVLFPSGARH